MIPFESRIHRSQRSPRRTGINRTRRPLSCRRLQQKGPPDHLRGQIRTYRHRAAHASTLPIEGKGSQKCSISEIEKGLNGQYRRRRPDRSHRRRRLRLQIHRSSVTYHLAVADAAEDQLKLFSATGNKNAAFKAQKLRHTLDGPQKVKNSASAPRVPTSPQTQGPARPKPRLAPPGTSSSTTTPTKFSTNSRPMANSSPRPPSPLATAPPPRSPSTAPEGRTTAPSTPAPDPGRARGSWPSKRWAPPAAPVRSQKKNSL